MIKTQSTRRARGQGRWTFYNDPPVDLVPTPVITTGEVMTFNHPEYPRFLGKGDVGGPFWSAQTYYSAPSQIVKAQGLGRIYEGTIHTSPGGEGDMAFPLSDKPSNFDSLVLAGTTAIARTIPTNPVAGASVAIGELREGIPHFITKGTLKEIVKDYRKLGDNHLNIEFGWKPLVRDLMSFVSVTKQSDKIIRQLYRDAGANSSVRRRYSFPTETSSVVTAPWNWGWVAPWRCDGGQLDSWMLAGGPQYPTGYTTTRVTETKTWFSGAYSYVMPPPPSRLMDRLRTYDAERSKLFGTRITPDTLWNLAPWSWAADWFSNTGDFLSNVSAFSNDSLVLKHGYIMRSIDLRDENNWYGWINTPSGVQNVSTTEVRGCRTKVRLRATPFGFGIDMGSLSPRQIAITVALGLSRGPRASL